MAEAEVATLAKIAARLSRAARRRYPGARPIPSLFFLTDPARTPDPARVMAALPRGAAVVYRAFGAPEAARKGAALRGLARRRRLVFLVGADPALACRLKADGVHLPERLMAAAPRLRRAHPRWLVTAAAHSPRALHAAARLGVDAALVSVVFGSKSPSAGRPMGPLRFAALVRSASLPTIALGGVSAETARRIARSHAVGLAAIGGLIEARSRT